MADSDPTICSQCGATIRPHASGRFVEGRIEHVICPTKPSPAAAPKTPETTPRCVVCQEPIRPTQNRTTIQGQDYHSHCFDRASRTRPQK